MTHPTGDRPSANEVAFLFTDIEGSTDHWEHFPEAMKVALARHDACLRRGIDPHGGTVYKLIGDAFHVAFHDPVDAVLAAVEAQKALAAEDWTACGEGFDALRVRMSLHIGEATMDARGDYRTPLLNRVARIESTGHGGQVLLSSDIAAAVGERLPPGIRLRDLGEHRLKDLRHAEHIFQVVAEGMPDVAQALKSAGQVGARDRIIVRDPTGDGADTLAGRATVVDRTVAETFAELKAVLRGDERTVVLTAEQVRAAAQHRPADLEEYRLTRIAEWSQPRYRLDGRFVELTLLVDQGEDAESGRWATQAGHFADLGTVLAAAPDPALVVLGPPGSGKSTLLRRLELDRAIANLRGEDLYLPLPGSPPSPPGLGGASVVTFFLQLNQYRPAEPGATLPSPERWLAERWAAAHPELTGLDRLLAEGRMILLLDGLNEMPTSSEREFRQQVGLWKDWLGRLATDRPGNRVIFSCRTLDYSAPLSTSALRVPQVQIEPLSDAQVRDFIGVYSPSRWREMWAALEGSPQLDVLRSPYFLALLVDQVEATGEMAEGRAALFTGFVRQSLKRELERGSPLFTSGELLTGRDQRRLAAWQWSTPWDLPERGVLLPKLSALAHAMQSRDTDGEASQLRIDLDQALALLDSEHDEAIVAAGEALAVLDEDQAAQELMYVHQLVQEYFAARELAKAPDPSLVLTAWRAADIRPPLTEVLAGLTRADALPPLPTTGWEETTLLAVAMAADPAGLIAGLMETNLALAGRCAVAPEVRSRLDGAFVEALRWALVRRSRDAEAELRERIACGLALGPLGDPRFRRLDGRHGAYLLPPMVAIPGGTYVIGQDEPIINSLTHEPLHTHQPRHTVLLAPFALGRFAVTNAEYACFMAAGGYDDERWWDTALGRAWRLGEGTAEGSKRSARLGLVYLRENPALLDTWLESGQFDETIHERWKRRLAMSPAELEAHLAELYPGGRLTEPRYWRDGHYNNPAQPVVGVSWFEARAYCAWLAAQSGREVSLPTEVEVEAAARGLEARTYAFGDRFELLGGNSAMIHLRQPTPVGVFVAGDTPDGLCDMAGNTADWTASLLGPDVGENERPRFAYPYDPTDGREDPEAGAEVLRVLRGSDFFGDEGDMRAASRDVSVPANRYVLHGFRVRSATPLGEL